MSLPSLFRSLSLCLGGVFFFSFTLLDAAAQSYTQTNRAFVPAPSVMGTGGATTAVPGPETAFFYNPAHLAPATSSDGVRLRLLGVRASMSTNLPDQYDYFRQDLQPAIEEGIDELGSNRLEQLYDEARGLGRKRAFLSGDVLLPALTARVGSGLSLGAGLFAHTLARYRFTDAGAGIPAIDLAAQGDVIGLATAAFDFSPQHSHGLSLGVSAKHVRRYLSVKRKPLDAFEENEDFYLLRGTSTGMDAGLQYTLPSALVPGRLAFGAAAFDLFATGFDYAYSDNLTKNRPDDPQQIATEEALANEQYALRASYRAGVAYTVPSTLDGPFERTTLALDYLGYADPPLDQSWLTHLRMGVQTEGPGPLHVRAGLTQGYPSAGFGARFSFMTFDYVFYGQEEGRYAGQVPSWNHAVQVAFGLF